MRILIAEDDFTSRSILVGVLTKCGHETVATENGAEAWAAMQQPDAPRLAILDWVMPEMDGIEVCRHIRTLETDQPPYIIILTSKDEKADIVAGLEAGADDYLIKPYDPGELHARVNVGQRMIEIQAKLAEVRNALAHEATHDPLTGINNRRAILDGLANELSRARRNGRTVGIGMCDLDHFKQINDSYGHQAGDEVLCGFTRIIQDSLREYDLIGRYGGEEFLVVTPEFGGLMLERVYERLCERVAKSPIHTRAGDISITVSIGVSSGTGDDTVDALLNEVDTALYQAKKDGRNRVSYADPQIMED
ncbi:MAG: diguanylate cyclase [Proteobacteria bacterium]|nr:diguanylate cyclase [Pseudomonadota bacterium]